MRLGPLITAALLIAAGAYAWEWIKTPLPPPQQQNAKRGEGRRSARADTAPVVVASVTTASVPLIREGIGTVQALSTVVVRAQTEGRLLDVAFSEGQMVKRGDVLARLDPTIAQAQLDQALARLTQSEATLASARNDLDRYQRLALSNAGPRQQAEQQAGQVAQLEAQVKADTALVANARAVMAFTTITAPIDGRVGLRAVDPGNIVRSSDVNGLVSIVQVAPISVVFTLPQRDLPAVTGALARGAPLVEVTDPDSRGVLAAGKLKTLDNQIDLATGTIKLKAEFPNDAGTLWPGQYVSARLVVDTLINAKTVPATAIRRGPQGAFVYVVSDDLKAEVRTVTVALQDQARAVVSDGLDVGERVVTLGFAQLTDGKAVEITDGVSPDQPKPSGTSRRPNGVATPG